jgi:hypothetical protein
MSSGKVSRESGKVRVPNGIQHYLRLAKLPYHAGLAGSSPGLQKQPRIARGRQNCRRGLWQGRAQFFLPSPDRLRRPGENPVG